MATHSHTSRTPPRGLLSVVLICRNSQDTIQRTLDSTVPLARELGGEVVALDNGSTDNTINMLERAGARVERVAWLGYINTKQKALEASTSEWTLCIDSDESLEPDLISAIRHALANPPAGIAGFRVNRKMWYAGAWLNHAWQPEWRLRLVRTGAARWGGIDPHDKLELHPGAGAIADLPRSAVMRHDSMSSAAEFLARQVRHSRLSATNLFERGVRSSPLRIVTSACGAFLKQLVIKQAFRDGWRGSVAAACMSIATAMKHAMLVELAGLERERRK